MHDKVIIHGALNIRSMLLYYIETNVCSAVREREFIDTAQQERN